MTATICHILAAAISFFAGPQTQCPAVTSSAFTEWDYLALPLEKEPPRSGQRAKRFLESSNQWLQACPHNEVVWYAVLRALELTTKDQKAPFALVESARTAVPRSVHIETVRARTLGSVEAAKDVLKVDPLYAPAVVALGTAYESRGEHHAALEVLQPLRSLHLVAGGPLLLARVAFALGNFKLAADAARREPTLEGPLVEHVDGLLHIGEARTLEGDARLKLGQARRALLAFYDGIIYESPEPLRRLQWPVSVLRQAIEKEVRKPDVPDQMRGTFYECLGLGSLREGNISKGLGLLVKANVLPNYYGNAIELPQTGDNSIRDQLKRLLAGSQLSSKERAAVMKLLDRWEPSASPVR
jgi:hypothetical protein